MPGILLCHLDLVLWLALLGRCLSRYPTSAGIAGSGSPFFGASGLTDLRLRPGWHTMTRANPRGGCKEASTDLVPADFAPYHDLARHSLSRYSTSDVPPLSSDQLRGGVLAAHALLVSNFLHK